jgi:D-alanyl-D-alanine carboxypeptidase/D-alanyl-D-alanine-endopeptidase (penicillin-binding protein 4)
MATNHWSESWLKALPVGGVDGTLQGRFTDGPGRNRVHAKTGSLRGVQALAGYVTTAAGQPVAFSIYANQFNPAESSKVRRTIDQLVTELAGYTNHLGEISPARKN